MAKKNARQKEAEAPPAAETLKTAEPPDHPAPTRATALSDQIEKLRAFMSGFGFGRPPGWVEELGPVDAAIAYIEQLHVDMATLRTRIADLEDTPRAVPTAEESVTVTVPTSTEPDHKALAVQAYDLFRQNQAEGDFPSWDALDTPTQKLWRDSYAHVAGGGKPRTDYEQAVRYLIVSAQ